MTSALLEIKNIHVRYAAVKALNDVSLQIFPGELVSLIGANGAGKTTLLKSIVNLLPSESGKIIFSNTDITKSPTHTLAAKGLSLVPEGRGLFPQMSVVENILMGAHHRKDSENIQHELAHTYTLFPRLRERQHQASGTLSGGEQQMVAIARALMSKPTLLLLDEPSMGLAPLLVKAIFDVIKAINQDGVSILLVEQNAHAALSLASRGYVLEHGEMTLSGNTAELVNNPKIKAAYLGA